MVNFGDELGRFPKSQWPRPPGPDMPEEQMVPHLVERYQVIEKDWRASNAYRDLFKRICSRPINVEHIIINCVCFGTGTFSGLRRGKAFTDDKKNDVKEDAGQKVALYQIAIFKSIVDDIETQQFKRPASFAQEPTYNRLDFEFLESLNITVKNVNSGFEFVNNRSLVYLPSAECCVAIEVKKLDPDILLSTGPFDSVTYIEDKDWTNCGFPSGLQHGDLTGSKAALCINDEFHKSRDWQTPMHFASLQLKRHEPAYKNPMLAIRKECVLCGDRGVGEPAGTMASALSEEMALITDE